MGSSHATSPASTRSRSACSSTPRPQAPSGASARTRSARGTARGCHGSPVVTPRTGSTSGELAQNPIASPGVQSASQGTAPESASGSRRRTSKGPPAASARRARSWSTPAPSTARSIACAVSSRGGESGRPRSAAARTAAAKRASAEASRSAPSSCAGVCSPRLPRAETLTQAPPRVKSSSIQTDNPTSSAPARSPVTGAPAYAFFRAVGIRGASPQTAALSGSCAAGASPRSERRCASFFFARSTMASSPEMHRAGTSRARITPLGLW